jgi:hypothetical protein
VSLGTRKKEKFIKNDDIQYKRLKKWYLEEIKMIAYTSTQKGYTI